MCLFICLFFCCNTCLYCGWHWQLLVEVDLYSQVNEVRCAWLRQTVFWPRCWGDCKWEQYGAIGYLITMPFFVLICWSNKWRKAKRDLSGHWLCEPSLARVNYYIIYIYIYIYIYNIIIAKACTGGKWQWKATYMYIYILYVISSFSSIVIPRNLFSVTLSIVIPSIWIFICVFILQFPNSIILILLQFNDNLFLSNHTSSLPISEEISFNNSCKLSPKWEIEVLLANNTNFNTLDTLHMSWIYKMKQLGPNPDPCGTPQAQAWGTTISQLHKLLRVWYSSSPSLTLPHWCCTVPVFLLICHDL